MNSIQCGFAADTQFGPSVAPCRREFDFTIFFEETILSIAPTGAFVLVALGTLFSLRNAAVIVRYGRLYTSKIVAVCALAAVQIAILVVQSLLVEKTAASIASAAVSLVASIFVCLLSHFEHLRSFRPSSAIVSFLSITILCYAARTRTHWLAGNVGLASTLSVDVGLRLVALYYEAQNKGFLLIPRDEKTPDEVLAGPISRTLFHWLNGLMTRGYRGLLHPEDFSPIDNRLLSAHLRQRFRHVSDRYATTELSAQDGASSPGLLWLSVKALGRVLVGPIIARLLVTAFTFTQPFLVDAALTYLESDDPVPASHGYGLIGAAFLCYVGIAAAYGWYWHQAYRCAVTLRGGLAITIFDKLLRLPEGDKLESQVTILMVGDLQRIMGAASRGHEVWAGTIETGLATWLLYRQLGPSCFVMLGIAAVAGIGSIQIVKKMGSSQQKWLAATQRRIKRTKQMLDSLKAIKMMSQDTIAYQTLEKLRLLEIHDSSSVRWIIIISCFLSYTTLALSPPLVIGVYVGTAGSNPDFSISKVFTSLVIIALLASPLMNLFQVLPALGSAHGCFQRIHNFLMLQERIDYRGQFETEAPDVPDSANPTAHEYAMSLQNLSLGWKADSPVLSDINLDIRKGSSVAIVGPVGSGKSLLLKGLIGEAQQLGGQLTVAPSASFAYCSQTAWLENVSVHQNMTQYGTEAATSDFYKQLALDCVLDDLVGLSTFATGSVGSGGVMLSGGQRQRLALARALSTKSDILVLDDVFSALDRRTRWRIAMTLFKQSSAKASRTIIYTTHDERIAELADEVYEINESGHLSRRKSQTVSSSMNQSTADTSEIESLDNIQAVENTSDEEKPAQNPEKAPVPNAVQRRQAKDMLGDRQVYKIYFKSVGLFHSIIFILGAMAWALSFKFSDIWVRWWTDASAAGDNRSAYWLGIYAALGALSLIVLSSWIWHEQFFVIARSGRHLHGQLAKTVLKAQFPVISQIDTGTTLNRFSQDLMFVDMQLPMDLFNTTSGFFEAIIQIVLISVASLPALCAIPVLFVLLYIVQHFYLRTSKQLRLHELETKAMLHTKIAEAGSGPGLSTIRAHGWSDVTMKRFQEALDRSQEPLYLLYAVQRWLQVVLNLIVAGLVVMVLGVSVALKASNKVSPGAVGVAFLNAVTLGETMTQFIISWTGLETSLGAIARISLFDRETPAEQDSCSASLNSSSEEESQFFKGPGGSGAIRFENVWATYNSSDMEAPQWSLRGVSLDIKPGERVAICGKTGSGKSTMHLALLRMVNIPIGSIYIDGVDHSTMSLETLRKGFYVISQDKQEGFDTLRQELDPHGAFSNAHIEAVLQECGVLDMLLSAGGLTAKREECKFSAGEEQLVGVVRIILDAERRGNEGGIVLLDEATSSVDRETEEKMEMLIRTKLSGKTLVAINHRLEAVMDYDRVVVLEAGQVADVGTPAEMVQRSSLFAGLRIGSKM